MQDRFEHFSCAIFEITRYWHKIASEEMGKYGLKAVHAVYILSLARNAEDGMTVGQLCEDCSRDKAETSRMLAILVKHGLVKNPPHPARDAASIISPRPVLISPRR